MHPYGIDPDWYSETLRPEYEPVSPDGALDLLEKLRGYCAKYPSMCVSRPMNTQLPVECVDCAVPGYGLVTYMYAERISLVVFLQDQPNAPMQRVYRYLFLDQLEEEDYAIHQIRAILRRHVPQSTHPQGPALRTEIRSGLESDVLRVRDSVPAAQHEGGSR